MAITPSTNLKILKNPLELDNKNQITFANKQDQFNYFDSLEKIEIDDIYYQRKDSTIQFPAHIDSILEYNYCMYQNENYGNKWFYAFITNMKYENDGVTIISISTDVFQTWQFDLNFKQCFVEREMLSVNEDIPGANLFPEGLETGEFKIGGTADFDELLPVAIVAYTRNPYDDGLTTNEPIAQGVIANGIPTGVFYCICSLDMLQGLLSTINSKGFGESIMTVFTVPAFALDGYNGLSFSQLTSGTLLWFVSDFKANPITKNLVSTPNNLDGYTPRNQKLRTYPYIYLGFNPSNGSSKIYRYENFQNGTPVFKMYSEINQNPSVAFIPQNYRGATGDSMSDMSILQGYPAIGWITDYYNTWLAQNSKIIELQNWQEEYTYNNNIGLNNVSFAQSIANGLSSALSLNLDSTIASGIETGLTINNAKMLNQNHGQYIQMQLAQKEQQQMLPNSATLSGSNATLLGYGLMDNNIFTRYTIKKEFAEKIDKYFDMYGYLTNTVKVPNINNRPNWNYIKTIGANILANIPQNDLDLIKQIFDNGVTLWHNTNTFLDYSQNNR